MSVLPVALLLTFSRGAFVGFMMINGLFLLWNFTRTVAIAIWSRRSSLCCQAR
jgi:hypothetical protein